mgnify:CR=1 FL=1
MALFMDKAFRDRKLAVLKASYEEYQQLAADYAGPAVVETFGEEGFAPVNKESAWSFDEKQQKLRQYAELQYQEKRLELLLNAKGIQHSLAVLSSEQANIIVPEDILQKEYEKLYDLVLRNTDYEESQIILVPLK